MTRLIARITKVLLTIMAVTMLGPVAGMAQPFGQLQGQAYGSGSRALVVVLHGDVSKGGPADYHYKFAQQIAQQNKGVVAVALLRPGYADSRGRKSAGSTNNRRDHYTAKNNRMVADAIKALKAGVKPQKTIVVGHSGGAAQLGAVIGQNRGIANSAILVSCPCDITAWRQARGRSAWTNSQSPIRYVNKIGRGTRVIAMVGKSDDNTFPALSERYVAAAQKAGVPAAYAPVSGNHGFNSLSRSVAQAVKSEINQ